MLVPFANSQKAKHGPWPLHSVSKQWLSPWREENPLFPSPSPEWPWAQDVTDVSKGFLCPYQGDLALPNWSQVLSEPPSQPSTNGACYFLFNRVGTLPALLGFSPMAYCPALPNPVTASLMYDLLMD